ncbi:DoxX family membrane protein [Paracidobacterium acidisoli]|uniref:DoxX family membrane protein n=1 Tax=Paracidobacterium acidisoli TaxID=2303751 RepID=A0A372IIY6_9BACT|nr:DoxX family membrane protein [Paracidobacterium acidisoli]MBT9333328.1 DoxX family membrane protein [Paracidobacterium acidisoli]
MEKPAVEFQHDGELAYLLLRITIGTNICMHGVSRILSGTASFAHSLLPLFQKTPLPGWAVLAFGLTLPWLEAVFGLLVLLGLCTRFALLAGSLLLIALTFGSTLRQDWESAGLQLIYAAVYTALLAFRNRNVYSLDSLFGFGPRTRE